MTLRTQFTEDMKTAMRAKDVGRVGTIRLIIAKMKEADIEARGAGRGEATREELIVMLQKMIKQRNDSIEAYEKGGRQDLAGQERSEIAVIEGYLPSQLSPEDVTAAIKSVIADLGASGIKDMGRVIAALKERYAGQIDFGKASPLVKAALGA